MIIGRTIDDTTADRAVRYLGQRFPRLRFFWYQDGRCRCIEVSMPVSFADDYTVRLVERLEETAEAFIRGYETALPPQDRHAYWGAYI